MRGQVKSCGVSEKTMGAKKTRVGLLFLAFHRSFNKVQEVGIFGG